MADEKAADYGESDIEARAMTERAARRPAEPPPPAPEATAQGTTETDIAANIREKVRRESKP